MSVSLESGFFVRDGVLEHYYGQASQGIRTPPGVRSIGYKAFGYGALDIYVSDGVEEIKAGAFFCPYLMHLRLPDSIKTVENKVHEFGRSGSEWAINLDAIVSDSPVRATIECSYRVKQLLLADYDEEERRRIEEGIEWK